MKELHFTTSLLSAEIKLSVKQILVFYLLLVLSEKSFSQYPNHYDPNSPPNEYRSSSNPFYWKNRKPYDGYWQQDVYYKINANIDERTDIITGEEWLTYYNNSPDTLRFVFFHLYQQAFVKGGHIENLSSENNVKTTFGHYESQGLGEMVESIKANARDMNMEDFGMNDEVDLQHENDFSVMKVFIPNGILPNDSIRFHIKFKTYFDSGSERRRMKKFSSSGFTHYDGVHWYPRICVYDRKFGWDTDQHLGREFYGDFGTYDVHLTFASDYMVGATGTLLNEKEVLPDSLRQKLDIRNFAKKQWNSKASVVIPYDSSQRKTWHFYAENVHDFAWTADPTYRIGEYYATIYDPDLKAKRTVLCQSLAQESHASGWQDAAIFTARCIEIYSRDFGAYRWPKIIVADAADGMEYPMLTLDGGYSPGYYDVLSHEVGHMWFFGQVGNNETYRAALDEGFTQFLESWSLKHIIGDTMLRGNYKGYVKKFKEPVLVTDAEVYLPYLQDAARGIDESINQHSDAFNGALGHGGGYRQVYFKTGTMLYNLQYVMGDSLFQNSMKHYFSQWKFCHPYFDDFRNSIINYSHVDLNWFFDEWMETTKTIDYKVKSQKSKAKSDSVEITFSRRGRSQMPIDFEVLAKDGKKYEFYIPNTWYDKKTDATVLPKWYGWDKLHPTYDCTVNIPSGVKQVTIDPSHRLADVYMPDNYLHTPINFKFDSQVSNVADWKTYRMSWRPDIWYNAVDGLKLGLHLDGNYFDLVNKFSLTAWFNSTLLQNGIPNYNLEEAKFDSIFPVSFNFTYSTNTHWFLKNSSVDLSTKYLDGLLGGSASFSVSPNAKNTFSLGVKSMYRPTNYDLSYLLYPEQWNAKMWNNYAYMNLHHTYNYFKGNGDINLKLRSASLFSDYGYSDLTLTAINKNHLGKFDLSTRLTGRIGTGDYAPESELYLAGESPEEMMDNKFVRSKAFVPNDWLGYADDINHFQQGGGLNLRGYAGYAAPEEKDSIQYLTYAGKSGAAVNAELDYDNLIKLHPKIFKSWLHIDSYVFGDAGSIGYQSSDNKFHMGSLRADAGLGFCFTVKSWGSLQKVKPFTLRADFPLFINRVPAVNPNYFDFRWVIGVGRSF